MNGCFYRGEIYYVLYDDSSVGSEQRSGRPGIIVSNDQNNRYASTLEIVYLTTKEKKPLPTHVHIEASRIPSTALCEQIFTVDKSRIGDYIGKLTSEEMNEIETGILISLGLNAYLTAANEDKMNASVGEVSPDDCKYIVACTQRDVYKDLCMRLIERK